MTPLIPVLTQDGLRAVFRADHEGLQARISHIAFGDRAYSPTGAEAALQNERVRVPIAGGSWVGDFTIHMTALLDAGPSFWLREVGIYLTDGTLLAVWSHATTPLSYKTAGVPIVTAFDLSLEALPASAITVEAGDVDLTLFFGSEFAQLGAAVLGNARRIQAQGERVEALEELPSAISTHAAMIGRLEAENRQLDTRSEELLGLAAQLGTTALNNTGRIQAQGERVEALKNLPGAVTAVTEVIDRMASEMASEIGLMKSEISRTVSDVDALKAAQLPQPNMQANLAHGNYSFVVPAGVTRIHGRLVGGGGGAAGVGHSSTVGGAAKPGGAAEGWFDVVPGQVIPIVVGAGGAGGAASANVLNANGGNGGNGGTSGISTFMSATGGAGGGAGPSTCGAGGIGTGGSLHMIGGMGGDGGGSAGTRIYGGNGGASIFGGGGRAATSYTASTCDGRAPGSGGGSVYYNWAAGGKGGDGADGAVILQW